MTAPVPASSFPYRTDGAAPPPMDPSVRVDCTAAAPSNPASDDGLRRMRGIAEALLSCPWEPRTCPECKGTKEIARRLPCGVPGCKRPCKHERTWDDPRVCRACDSDGIADCCVTCGWTAAGERIADGPNAGKCSYCLSGEE